MYPSQNERHAKIADGHKGHDYVRVCPLRPQKAKSTEWQNRASSECRTGAKKLLVGESNPGRLRDRQKCYQLHQRGLYGRSKDWVKSDTFSIFACHPCAGAMLIFSVSFQFLRMMPKHSIQWKRTRRKPERGGTRTVLWFDLVAVSKPPRNIALWP